MRTHTSINLVVMVFMTLFIFACTMSVKPEMKQRTDSLLANYKSNSRTIEATESSQPMQWRVGQWAVYRMTDPKGNVSHIKYAIVAKNECGIWLEVNTQSYYSHDIQKSCYSSMPSAMAYDSGANAQSVIDSIQVTVIKNNDNDVQVMDFRKQDPFTKSLLKNIGQNNGVQLHFGPKMLRDNRKVVAGTFLKTFRTSSKLSFGPFSYEADIWSHPAVPITGQVYSKSTDGKYTTELLSYGEQGAKSALSDYP